MCVRICTHIYICISMCVLHVYMYICIYTYVYMYIYLYLLGPFGTAARRAWLLWKLSLTYSAYALRNSGSSKSLCALPATATFNSRFAAFTWSCVKNKKKLTWKNRPHSKSFGALPVTRAFNSHSSGPVQNYIYIYIYISFTSLNCLEHFCHRRFQL